MKGARLVFPRKVFFGLGALEKGLGVVPELGRRAVLFTGRRWAVESGTLSKVERTLKRLGMEVLSFSGIRPNPDRVQINELAEKTAAFGPDVLIALGGGSVVDATKAIALTARMGGDVWSYVMQRPKRVEAYPVVAIPTVAGSGSEFDGAAVINNREERAKMPLSLPELVPVLTILDPELHQSVPPDQTALGAVDIFCQFFEPFLLGEGRFPFSEELSLLGMRETIRRSREVLRHPEDLSLRAEMVLLASLSMSALGRLGRGGGFSLHWLEHVLSGHYPEIPHPQGLASLLPAYLRHHIPRNPRPFIPVSLALTGSGDPEALIPYLELWLEDLGVKKRLRELGVKEEDLSPMAGDVLRYYGWAEGGRVPGPVPMDREAVLQILQDAF